MQPTNFEPVKVNGIIIDENILAKEIQFYPAATLDEARQQAAQELVLKELLKQTALAQGFGDDEDAIDNLLASVVEINEPSNEECRAYFDEHPQAFYSEPLFAASHILLAVDTGDIEKREQLLTKAREMIEQLTQKPNLFERFVSAFSECSSKEQNGQLEQITKGTTVPEFEAAIINAPVGLVTEPIETEFGIHIIRVDHRDEGRPLPFEYVESRIKEHLLASQYHRSVNQYLHSLVAQASIEGVIL